MAGSEPLIREADPHIMKLAIEARMQDKDGPPKKNLLAKPIYVIRKREVHTTAYNQELKKLVIISLIFFSNKLAVNPEPGYLFIIPIRDKNFS